MEDSEFRRHVQEAFRLMDQDARHPSLDQMTRFARGEGSGAARLELEKHFSVCALCGGRLKEFEEFLADCENPPARNLDGEWQEFQRRIRRRKIFGSPLKWGSIAAAALAAIGGAWLMLRPEPAERLLAQAYREQRTIEYRVAGAPNAGMRVERGGGSAFSMPPSLLKAQARLAEQIQKDPDDPDLLRLKGEAEMLAREPAAAVQTLQKAADLRARDARILAALGCAYALRGDMERQPVDYPKALEYLGQSLELQPGNAEAVFNRALLLERMLLLDQAVNEWESYLRMDGAGAWSAEARQRLAELKSKMNSRERALRQVVKDPAQFLALRAAGEALDAEAYLRDVAITEWLPRVDRAANEAATDLAKLLHQKHGDDWLADLLASPQAPSGLQQLALARAANQKLDARAAIESARLAQASFARAANRPGELWARFEEVIAQHILFQSQPCFENAERLTRDLDGHSYPWLRAQGRIEYAVCAMRTARLNEATVPLRQAMELSQAAGLGDCDLRAAGIFLGRLRYIGVPSEIFSKAAETLRIFWNGAYPILRYNQVVDELRIDAGESDQRHAAYFFARSAVWAAKSAERPLVEAAARQALAASAQALGHSSEVRENVEIGDRLFADSGPDRQYRLGTQITLATAELDSGNPDAALRRLEELSGKLPESPMSSTGSDYYAALGEVYRRKGMSAQAKDAFRRGIAIGNDRLASLRSERERTGVLKDLDRSYRGLVATLIASPVSSPQGERDALELWQSYRLLDSVGTPGRVRRHGGAVLSFVELPEGFAGWLACEDRIVFHRLAVSKPEAAAAISRFLRESSEPGSDPRGRGRDARLIYRWMLEPFAMELERNVSELTVELDGVLTAVPLQALQASNGQFVCDRFSLLVSAGYAAAEQTGPPGPTARVLVVANPAVLGASAARFPPLSDSLREAAVVRAAFASNTLLEGRNATAGAIESLLPTAEVVHFAGHGYVSSGNGALLLAPKDSTITDYDILRPADLLHQDWSRCRLAVLSACAAAAGESRGAHNPDSLVRALTRAGVPNVAASLWSVDSAATAELMKSFYETLAKGSTPAIALRAAQQSVRLRPEWAHPYYWAGFQLYGTI